MADALAKRDEDRKRVGGFYTEGLCRIFFLRALVLSYFRESKEREWEKSLRDIYEDKRVVPRFSQATRGKLQASNAFSLSSSFIGGVVTPSLSWCCSAEAKAYAGTWLPDQIILRGVPISLSLALLLSKDLAGVADEKSFLEPNSRIKGLRVINWLRPFSILLATHLPCFITQLWCCSLHWVKAMAFINSLSLFFFLFFVLAYYTLLYFSLVFFYF